MDSTAKKRSITQTWFEIALWKRILTAMVIGALLGSVWGPGAEAIGWIGDLFIRLIRMIVVPLVFVTIVSGVVSMGDPSKLGSLGVKTLILYMLTTLGAITIGLILAVFLQPGVGVDLTGAPASTLQETVPLSERLISIVPENPIAALAEGNILAIIFFAILIGVGLLSVGESGKPVADFMDASSEVVLRITHWIMEIAPFGVLALIARVTGAQGFDALLNAVVLAITVLIACAAHLVLTHGVLIMQLMLKLSPINFFRGAREAMLVAFSTSSSAATLPVSMSAAEDNLGVKPVVASTVLPLGATINMDGTAIMQGVATVFIAQVFGVDLSINDYLMVILTATLASVGTAGVPGVGLIMLAMVLNQVGLPVEGIALIIGVDRLLDMTRTAVNVTGDCMVTCAVAKSEKEFDEDIFNDPDAARELEETTSKT